MRSLAVLIAFFVFSVLFTSHLSASEPLYKKHLADGMSASEAGNYEEAEAYLKKALRADPLSPKVNLELGLLYKKMGFYSESRDFLMAVQELAPGTDEASIARRNLVPEELAADGKETKNWSVNLTTGIQYDSNVILTSDDSAMPEGISNESDRRVFFYLNSNYLYPVTKRLSIGPTFAFYQSLHAELDEFDTRQFRPGLEIRHLTGNSINLSLRYDYENTLVGEDTYLLAHNITPEIIISEGNGLFSVVRYRYKNKDFRDSELFTANDERDGDNHQIQINQYIPLFKSVTMRIGYAYDRDSTDTDFWSYDGHMGYVGYKTDLGNTLVFDISGQYYKKDYDADYPGSDQNREDDTTTFSLSLSKTISSVFDASIGYIYMSNSSNFDVFDYDRSIVTLTVRLAL